MTTIDETVMDTELEAPTELEVLQARATKLGLKYHPKAGVEKLKVLINNALTGDDEEEVENKPSLSEAELLQQKRMAARKESLALVRVQVTAKDPAKKNWDGAIFTVSNKNIGTVRKFVKFDAPWHVPKVIYDMLKEKEVQLFKSVRDKQGATVRQGYIAKAYSVEVLPQLSQDELEAMAADQKARNAIE